MPKSHSDSAHTKALKNSVNSINPDLDQPKIASPWLRLIAIVYDGMLILALLFLVGAILVVIGTLLTMEAGTTAQEAQSLPIWYQSLVMSPAFVLTLVGFYGVFWRRAGQTLGMQTWRLKTVDDQGRLLSWRLVFRRILAACIWPVFLGAVGFVVQGSRGAMLWSAFFGFLMNYGFCWLNQRGLAVHDLLSGTMTLKMPKIHHESLWQSFKKSRALKKQKSDLSDPSS